MADLVRSVKKLRFLHPGERMAHKLRRRADELRDSGHFRAAGVLYEEALRVRPGRAAAHVQAGHMFKEAGEFVSAERHYLEARRLMPQDADLALQIGHFYKMAERPDEAEASYERALALKPDWHEAALELGELRRHSSRTVEALGEEPALAEAEGLVPELFPRSDHKLGENWIESVNIRRLGGRRERSPWGVMKAMSGVEAIRGFCISSSASMKLDILLDGDPLHSQALEGVPTGRGKQRKYAFNVWLDFAKVAPGRHVIELRLTDALTRQRTRREHVLVVPPLSEAEYPVSDGVIELPADDPRPVEEQVNTRPSVARPARRTLLPGGVRNILVQRVDQLGDMVTSVPAIRRLRELFPDARLVGLVTSANQGLAETLGLFDEVIVADFPDDPDERRRVMPARTQEALRQRLAPYHFDVAIDLAESAVSRPLLLLAGARFTYGFHERDWPWLSGGLSGGVHDPHNYSEIAPQSSKVLALVEAMALALQSRATVERRDDLHPTTLARHGLKPGERFAVFHTGARIVFSRWPHFAELARMVLARTDLRLFILTDDAAQAAELAAAIGPHERLQVIAERLPFDEFDAFLSFCTVFVGNDSGPKHLAAMRGSNVVSLHSARINWNEWGQELSGTIISRKVPCAGCAIFHDADECAKGFACITRIQPEEVFAEVAKFL